jgi:hypothetical protein
MEYTCFQIHKFFAKIPKSIFAVLICSNLFGFAYVSQAQTNIYLLQEDFSSIASGNNTGTTGSTSAWVGDTNFPTVVSAYKAGGVVKLGTSSAVGSLTTKTLDLSVNGGSFNVSFDVKGWTTVEGSIKVTVSGLTSQTVTYTSTMSSASFENKVLSFTGGIVNSTLKIETTAKRAFIDNVNIYYASSCNPSNLGFLNSSITKSLGNSAFTQAATSLDATTPIVYLSSTNSVATVNSSTGEVTIVGVGTSTITANQASANGYCASTANYLLTVTPSPTLIVTDLSNLNLLASVGKTGSQPLNVSAVNLSSDLQLNITGTDASLFSLSQYTVPQIGGNVPSTSIFIYYSPIALGINNADLTISSVSALSLIRTLNGTATLNTGIETLKNQLNVFVENGNIKFTTMAGEKAEIYNSIGHKLFQTTTVDGMNTIQLSIKGIILVKVGSKTAKVVL